MGAKKKLKKYNLYVALFTIIFIECDSTRNTIKNIPKDNYYFVDNFNVRDSCNLYKMVFYEGDYLFRIALSGNCNTLTSDEYVNDYEVFLKQYIKKINKNKKYIRFEYYKSTHVTDEKIERIKEITQSYFNKNILVIKEWEEGLELELH
jgi:hypothetical protein